jgi:WhiB family redox-sensing transcriptional regulator
MPRGRQLLIQSTPDWHDEAICKGATKVFYPDANADKRESVRNINRAKKICAGCPVRVECLEYAIENGEDKGVWGGTSERERRRMRKIALHKAS